MKHCANILFKCKARREKNLYVFVNFRRRNAQAKFFFLYKIIFINLKKEII